MGGKGSDTRWAETTYGYAMMKTLSGFILTAALLLASVTAQAGLPEAESAYQSKNFKAAIREFEPLAVSGVAAAQFYIGLMFDNGEGLPQSHQRAMGWYLKAAKQGYAPAQSNLGVIYERGTNVDLSLKEAVSWYRKAAARGYAPAQFNLGLLYYNGRGDILRSYKEAASWYLKAAEQGYAVAQNSVGNMYENGLGLRISLVQAYKWYSLAAEAGNEMAQINKAAVEVKMAPDMIEKAQALAQQWLAKHKK